MRGFLTGIELAPNSCVLVKVRRGRGAPRLSALHVIEPAEWPEQDLAAGEMLGLIRRQKDFPRHAFVVGWRIQDSASAADPATLAALRLLLDAGFVIDAVATPPRALGALAGDRARPSVAATAWLALERHGAAIAIVRGADVLYSRTLQWRYRSASRLNEQLLQRYSLVAHLAPELKRGIDVVRAEHNTAVDCAVTCGDLPDLRSLTMPLIEELDLEVETLDSLDGLQVTPSAEADRAAEYAPALRLACAVTALPVSPHSGGVRSWFRPAAAGVAIVAGGWWGLSRLPLSSGSRPSQPAQKVAPRLPVPTATSGASDPARPLEPVSSPPRAPDTRQTGLPPEPSERVSVAIEAGPPEALLGDRVPAVHGILLAADRRLAILDGAIVREGDSVGRRRVQRIEPEAVVLREPSGREIRAGIRRLKQARRP